MGTKERREREKTEVRTMILDAARELFAKEGYDAVSMRRIADAIEYSPTAIYVHFKDKAELMQELCNEDFGKMNAAHAGAFEIADPVERVRQLGLHYIRFGVNYPNHFRLMFMTKPADEAVMTEEQMREHGMGDPNRDGYALLSMTVKQMIEQGRVRPELESNPDLITQLLWAGVHGVASLHITRPDVERAWCAWSGADVLADQMINVLLRGILREGDKGLASTPKADGGQS
jgi:AcrR family transcriptional regulator